MVCCRVCFEGWVLFGVHVYIGYFILCLGFVVVVVFVFSAIFLFFICFTSMCLLRFSIPLTLFAQLHTDDSSIYYSDYFRRLYLVSPLHLLRSSPRHL